MGDAFYLPAGNGSFRSTPHTVGPWNPRHQHAGPPSALLARAVEECLAAPAADGGSAAAPFVHRVTVDVLGPVPVTDVCVQARVARPGRRVTLAEAELTAEGVTAMRASAWAVRADSSGAPRYVHDLGVPGPDSVEPSVEFPAGWVRGYLDAVEWRPVAGSFTTPGPATVWARPRLPLVAGEAPTPLQRLLVVADSGNGVSAALDPAEWLFVNTELTVHVFREPTGEWLCLEAATSLDGYGAGLAATVLHDRRGPVGRGAQALVVARRTGL